MSTTDEPPATKADIVERLRVLDYWMHNEGGGMDQFPDEAEAVREAADEIVALRKQIVGEDEMADAVARSNVAVERSEEGR